MNKKRNVSTGWTAIAGLFLVLFLASGCNYPTTNGDGGQTGGSRLQNTVTIRTPGERAIIPLAEKFSLEIPAHTLPEGSQVRISEVAAAIDTTMLPADQPFSTLTALGVYDICIQTGTAGGDCTPTYDNPLQLRFKVDPALLAKTPAVLPGSERTPAPADAFIAAYLLNDPAAGINRWVETAFTVDEATNEIVVTTQHLSLWALFGFEDDTVVSYHPHFQIYFNQAINAPVLSPNPSGDAIYDFVTDIRAALVAAYEQYGEFAGAAGKGFKLPEQTNVYVDNWDADKTAEWGWFSKNIEIPTTYYDLAELQHDAAHELFHAIQNEYVGVPSMVANRWWMEATADYAAAYIGTGNGLRSQLPHTFIRKPLDDSETMHMYQAAHFIKFLTNRGVNFKDLFEATMAASGRLVQAINSHLNTQGDSLAEACSDFAYEFYFGTGLARQPLAGGILNDLAGYVNNFTQKGATVSQMMDVSQNCASQLAAFRINGAGASDDVFTIKLLALEPTSGIAGVRYVIASSDGPGTVVEQGYMPGGGSLDVDVKDGYVVYFIATNIASQGGYVTVAIDKPDGIKEVTHSRTAQIYNQTFQAGIAFTLSSTHAFEIEAEGEMHGGEYFYMKINLLEPATASRPVVLTARANVAGLAYIEEGTSSPFIKESYWYAGDKVDGDEVIVQVLPDSVSPTRLTYEIIIHTINMDGDEYWAGGAVLIDLIINH